TALTVAVGLSCSSWTTSSSLRPPSTPPALLISPTATLAPFWPSVPTPAVGPDRVSIMPSLTDGPPAAVGLLLEVPPQAATARTKRDKRVVPTRMVLSLTGSSPSTRPDRAVLPDGTTVPDRADCT